MTMADACGETAAEYIWAYPRCAAGSPGRDDYPGVFGVLPRVGGCRDEVTPQQMQRCNVHCCSVGVDASIRPYNSTVTIHHFTLDNPSIPVYNKYNSKMYKGVTVL